MGTQKILEIAVKIETNHKFQPIVFFFFLQLVTINICAWRTNALSVPMHVQRIDRLSICVWRKLNCLSLWPESNICFGGDFGFGFFFLHQTKEKNKSQYLLNWLGVSNQLVRRNGMMFKSVEVALRQNNRPFDNKFCNLCN